MRLFKYFAMAGLLVLLAAPARAQPDALYTVSDVHVDATAVSSVEALNLAIAQGRPKAWTTLYRRLTRQQDWARQPDLDPQTLLRMSRGYTTANERRSTTRYVADVTYIFNAAVVRRVLRQAGIPFAQTRARRVLVVPMAPRFQSGAWAKALGAQAAPGAIVPFVLAAAPAPGLQNLDFATANWDQVAAAARQAGAAEAVLVQAIYADGKVTVNLKSLRAGLPSVANTVSVPLQQSVDAAYASAAQAAIAAMDDMWKARAVVDTSRHGHVDVDVRMSSLAQWGAIQTALSGIDTVTGYTVTAMDIGFARMSLSYIGSPEQLHDTLAAAGLSLAETGGGWTLTMGTSQ